MTTTPDSKPAAATGGGAATAERLLAIEASGRGCSVAVWADGALRADRSEPMERGQSERLAPMIRDSLAASGLAFADLQAVAVTRGPGGFTGVRIGLAAAQGVALAWRLPILAVSGFDLLAAGLPAPGRAGRFLLTVIDAKRPELYAAAYGDAGQPVLAPCLAAPADLPGLLAAALPGRRPLLLAGDARSQALPALQAAGWDLLDSGHGVLQAAQLAAMVAGWPLPAAPQMPQPLYLRPPDTTRPKARAPQPQRRR